MNMSMSMSMSEERGVSGRDPRLEDPTIVPLEGHLFSQQKVTVLPVRFLVLSTNEGHGNTQWRDNNGKWIEHVLAEAERQGRNAVWFVRTSEPNGEAITVLPNTAAYTSSQARVLERYCGEATPGMLTVIISGPCTLDAVCAGKPSTVAPLLVMRARDLDLESIQDTASILLHALGYCQGYSEDLAARYLESADGLAHLATWVRTVITEKGSAGLR